MPDPRTTLIRRILETSFQYSETPKFPLASGRLSRYYIDLRVALSYPDVRAVVGDLILPGIAERKIHAVGGMIIGAIPVAIAVSDAAHRKKMTIAAFAVRKEAKGHGTKKYIEGAVGKGDRVAVVEDVVTSGRSTVDAIRRCREEGLQVVKTIAVVDRQEQGGREHIEKCGVSFESVLTLKDLLDTYRKGR